LEKEPTVELTGPMAVYSVQAGVGVKSVWRNAYLFAQASQYFPFFRWHLHRSSFQCTHARAHKNCKHAVVIVGSKGKSLCLVNLAILDHCGGAIRSPTSVCEELLRVHNILELTYIQKREKGSFFMSQRNRSSGIDHNIAQHNSFKCNVRSTSLACRATIVSVGGFQVPEDEFWSEIHELFPSSE